MLTVDTFFYSFFLIVVHKHSMYQDSKTLATLYLCSFEGPAQQSRTGSKT